MCPKAWDLTSLGHHSSVQIGWTLWLSPLLCHIFSKINSILKCQTPFSGDKRSTPSYHPGRECFKIHSSAHQDQWQYKTSLWPKIQSLCLHRVKRPVLSTGWSPVFSWNDWIFVFYEYWCGVMGSGLVRSRVGCSRLDTKVRWSHPNSVRRPTQKWMAMLKTHSPWVQEARLRILNLRKVKAVLKLGYGSRSHSLVQAHTHTHTCEV